MTFSQSLVPFILLQCHKTLRPVCRKILPVYNVWYGPRNLSFYSKRNFVTKGKEGTANQFNLGPVGELNRKLSQGELFSDEHQTRIAGELQRVFDDIKSYSPPVSSIFSKLFMKKTNKNIPKGLYIYGSVGCGKTMLMDLFYSCVQVSNLLKGNNLPKPSLLNISWAIFDKCLMYTFLK